MALNQSNRLIRMTRGPLRPHEVVVTSLTGREAISRPFSFDVEFISTRLDLRPVDLIGSAVTLELDRRDQTAQPIAPRFFHGYVSRFAAGKVVLKEPGNHKFRTYRAEIVPWLWFLTQTARCYLFFPEKEDKTIFEVIEAVIARAGAELHLEAAADLQGIGALASRKVKHCVQYRETDFNFLSRTLEQYGVFYYFRFEDGKHTLVLDLKKNYPVCVEGEVTYPRVIGAQPTGDHITSWQHDYEFVPGKWSHTDYNYETPLTSLSTMAPRLPSVNLPAADKFEVYDYPGGYAVKPDGEKDARIRQEERELPHNSVDGSSTCRTFTPGYTFTLSAHPDDEVVSEQGKSYLLTSVEHSASQPSDETDGAGGSGYSNRFTCILDSVQFRPPRRTPRPVISGVQTAVVVGPKGSEIYTDPQGQGRIKVQFHWDRVGKKDEHTSCWIRVAQMWAGKGWGSVSTPRIGHEVIVEFLEGDPDQPIITGSVHNFDHQPPHTGVVSGLKSQTHKGKGSNQITMDDTAGKEKVTIHAQHDMDTTIENNETHTVVSGNRAMTVKAGTNTEVVKGNASLTIQAGTRSVDVTGGDYTGAATGKVSLHGKGKGVIVTGTPNVDITGTSTLTITSPNIDVGKALIKIHGTKIELVTAGGSITLDGSGVSIRGIKVTSGADANNEITGTKVALNGGGSSVELAAGGANLSGSKVTVAAAGATEITGSVVKIN